MKKNFLLYIAVFTINISFAQIKDSSYYPPVELKGTQLIAFKSAVNNQNYELYIELPASYKDNITKRYPVLYVLDGQWFFSTIKETISSMHYESYIPELIVVGIGWPDNYHANRNRDYFPAVAKDSTNVGDASTFLILLKSEIMHFVDSAYRSDNQNNVLQGQSAGGAFALYTLFHEPSLFNSYIISCPSLEYDEGVFFRYEKVFAEKHKELEKKIFITSSEYEEAITTESLFVKFIRQLRHSNYIGLMLDTLVVEKMGHATQYLYAVGRGLQFVFNRPDLLLDIGVLDQYVGNYDFGMTITREGKIIYVNFPTGRVQLHAESNEIFYVNGVPGTTEFTKDETGKVKGFTMTGDGGAHFVKKIN